MDCFTNMNMTIPKGKSYSVLYLPDNTYMMAAKYGQFSPKLTPFASVGSCKSSFRHHVRRYRWDVKYRQSVPTDYVLLEVDILYSGNKITITVSPYPDQSVLQNYLTKLYPW